MFEVESVPSRNNAPCLLLLLSMHNVLKNDRVQSLRLQTPQSDPLSIYICNSSYLMVSKRINSYLKVREGNERDVVRNYWYLSALCRSNGTHQSTGIRIYPAMTSYCPQL